MNVVVLLTDFQVPTRLLCGPLSVGTNLIQPSIFCAVSQCWLPLIMLVLVLN